MHRAEDIEKVLRKYPIEDVWGIGRRSAPKLHAMGIHTAYEYTQLSESAIRAMSGITGVRTWRELRSEPCIEFEDGFEAKISDQMLLDYICGRVSWEETREHIKVEEQKWIRKAKKFVLYDDQPYRIK